MRHELRRELEVRAGAIEEIWPLLRDVDMLSSCSTAVGEVSVDEPDVSWLVTLRRRIGRFEMTAPVKVKIVEEDVGRRLAIRGEGTDRKLGARLELDASLSVLSHEGAETLVLLLELDYQMTGQLASLGSAVVRRHAVEMVDEFSGNLVDALSRGVDR